MREKHEKKIQPLSHSRVKKIKKKQTEEKNTKKDWKLIQSLIK